MCRWRPATCRGATHGVGMLDLDDLPGGSQADPMDPRGVVRHALAVPALAPDSGVARALFHVWRGEPIVVLDAPPGSGKTTGVVTVLAHLVVRAGLRVVLACPTRAQAATVAPRLAEVLPDGTFELEMSTTPSALPRSVAMARIRGERGGAGWVRVVTLAACRHRQPQADLLVVDEAYQATFADVALAAANVTQLLLVGDPGQIGPVVTVDTSAFEHLRDAPHFRSPQVFAGRDGARLLHLDTTFRLGPASTACIAPLYPFAFTSARPPRSAVLDGAAIPEVARLDVGSPDGDDDVAMMAVVAGRAEALCLAAVHTGDGTRPARESDVAVVVARNSQVSTISAMLSARGLGGVTVGTADRLQGGQWTMVVALDPLAGAVAASGHAAAPGRTCVAVSRHTTHLTWVHAADWRTLLEGGDLPPADRKGAIEVRRRLCTQPVA